MTHTRNLNDTHYYENHCNTPKNAEAFGGKRKIPEKQPSYKNQSTTKVDRNRSTKPQTVSANAVGPALHPKRNTNAEQHRAKDAGIERRGKLRNSQEGNEVSWGNNQERAQQEVDQAVNGERFMDFPINCNSQDLI